MNSAQKNTRAIIMHFGISGLHNTSLKEGFFPADLPDDWLLTYYSNEFSLLLMKFNELDVPESLILNVEADISDELIEVLNELEEEIIEHEMMLVLDISSLSSAVKTMWQRYFQANNQGLSIVSQIQLMAESDFSSTVNISADKFSVKFMVSDDRAASSLCVVEEKHKMSPVEIRNLIEILREYALRKEIETLNVVFSAEYDALENCRNAIQLESMM